MNERDAVIARIKEWQANPLVAPLTCGNDSGHRRLVPQPVGESDIVLRCLDCDYHQTYIPVRFREPLPPVRHSRWSRN